MAITEQSGKKGEKGSFFDLSKSYLAPNVGGVEESGNNFAFIIIFLFLFFNTLGVLKGVRVYLFDTKFPYGTVICVLIFRLPAKVARLFWKTNEAE